MLVDDNPSLVFLRLYVAFSGFALGVERVEFLLQSFRHRFSRVYGASYFLLHYLIFHSSKNLNPFQFVPVIFRAIPDNEE